MPDPGSISTRAFRYGDGLFETLRVHSGKALNANLHRDRMAGGAEILGIRFPEAEWFRLLREGLQSLLPHPHGILRIQLTRSGRGWKPLSDEGTLTLDTEPLHSGFTALPPVTVSLFSEIRLPFNRLSAVKHCSRLPWIMAALHARHHNTHDALILGENGWAEAGSSNLFLWNGSALLTPPLQSGCLPGIMRHTLIGLAAELGIAVAETEIRDEDLFSAKEVFLTNSVVGLQRVGSIDKRDLPCADKPLFEKLVRELEHRAASGILPNFASE